MSQSSRQCLLSCYPNIWVWDYEYNVLGPEVERPVCLVAIEVRTRRRVRLFEDELKSKCPFDMERDLFVGFSIHGDIRCLVHYGWNYPRFVVDLYPEFRQHLYDQHAYIKCNLLNLAKTFGITHPGEETKSYWQSRIGNNEYQKSEKGEILDYCEQDVWVTLYCFLAVLPTLLITSLENWNGVLLRGRAAIAWSKIEAAGIPLNVEVRRLFNDVSEPLLNELRIDCNKDLDFYDELGTLKRNRIEAWAAERGAYWPRTSKGALDITSDVLADMVKVYPELLPWREYRSMETALKTLNQPLADDGRSRFYVNPYGSVTGRNQPGGAANIFGGPRWLRSMIKPTQGRFVSYVDFSNQEFAIAAALSGDEVMWQAYMSACPYIAFAKSIGLVPQDATKETHPTEREFCKAIVLGILFGKGYMAIAQETGQTEYDAKFMVDAFFSTHHKFAKFLQDVIRAASFGFPIYTRMHLVRQIKDYCPLVNPRSNQNYPMQGNGSDMLRLAVCGLTEAGITVIAAVHDALMIEGPINQRESIIQKTIAIMGDASEVILGTGKRCRVKPDTFSYPDVFIDSKAIPKGGTSKDVLYFTLLKTAQDYAKKPKRTSN